MRLIRASFALALLALLWPAASFTAVACVGSLTTGVVRVVSDGNDGIGIFRSATDTIQVNGVTCRLGGGGPIVDATVNNTATIQVVGGNAELDQNLFISLSGGPFAPGLGSEQGTPEIEFEVDLGPGQDAISVSAGGANENDTFAFGARGAALNDDADRDVILRRVEEAGAGGGAGNDLITAAGGFGTGAAFARRFFGDGDDGDDRVIGGRRDDRLNGYSGDDRLAGGSGFDVLIGDDGNDRLVGGVGVDDLFGRDGRDLLLGRSGADLLEGGRGKDELRAGYGRDILDARDGIRELVHGGPGRDRAKVDRGLDRVRAVEVLVDRLPRFRWGGD